MTKATLDQDKTVSSDQAVQDFLRKVTKIILLFLKDQNAPKELHRSVLKFTKVAITYLDFNKDIDMTNVIMSHIFSLKDSKKYSMTLRRIITKLIIRVGVEKLKQVTVKDHHPLIAYVERIRRKKQNVKERARLLALLG